MKTLYLNVNHLFGPGPSVVVLNREKFLDGHTQKFIDTLSRYRGTMQQQEASLRLRIGEVVCGAYTCSERRADIPI
jgi:hypothetical protein